MIKIKKDFVWILLVILNSPLFGQIIKISESLTVTKLSENTYIHTQKNNNGIVYFNNGEAVIVSTPDSQTGVWLTQMES